MNSDNKLMDNMAAAAFCLRFVLLVCGASLALSIPIHAQEPNNAPSSIDQMPSDLKPYASALGRRLEKAGKKNITVLGTVSYHGNAAPHEETLRITWQHPLRIEMEQGGNSITFDRNSPAVSAIGNPVMAATAQMLLEDSSEGFFALQKGRNFRRYLGSGFRLEGAKSSDPGVDVMLMASPDSFQNGKIVLKSYWFNSRTKLLGVVAYTSSSGVPTHTIIDDWREVDGEKIPFRIERWESNKLVVQIKIESATVSDNTVNATLGGN